MTQPSMDTSMLTKTLRMECFFGIHCIQGMQKNCAKNQYFSQKHNFIRIHFLFIFSVLSIHTYKNNS